MTKNQYFQLLGLLTLAQGHIAALKTIQRAAETITGEKDGHTQDVVWSGEAPESGADFLLEQLEVDRVGI